MTTPQARGRILTFYSYKGGTGRSLALANVAWILASNGKRVLAVDWDLEAPGLHRYFRPFLTGDPELSNTPGLIEFVGAYELATLEDADEEDWVDEYTDIGAYARSLDYGFREGGTLDLVGAGRQDEGYAARINQFDWNRFYAERGGGSFLQAVAERARETYDYILIDSRTGVSDTSGICTIQLPDLLAVFYTLNRQSILGAADVARRVRLRRQDMGRPLPIFPVPTRIELGEQDRLGSARARSRVVFNEALNADLGEYWSGAEILYVPYYAYEETLAVFADAPGESATSLLSALETLTGRLTSGAVSQLVPPTERDRQAAVAGYAFATPRSAKGQDSLHSAVPLYDAMVLYGPDTEECGEALQQLLEERGLRLLGDVALELGSRERLAAVDVGRHAARSVAVVLSEDYLEHSGTEDELKRLTKPKDRGDGPRSSLVAVLESKGASAPRWMRELPGVVVLGAGHAQRLAELVADEAGPVAAARAEAPMVRELRDQLRQESASVTRLEKLERRVVKYRPILLTVIATLAIVAIGGATRSFLADQELDAKRMAVVIQEKQHSEEALQASMEENASMLGLLKEQEQRLDETRATLAATQAELEHKARQAREAADRAIALSAQSGSHRAKAARLREESDAAQRLADAAKAATEDARTSAEKVKMQLALREAAFEVETKALQAQIETLKNATSATDLILKELRRQVESQRATLAKRDEEIQNLTTALGDRDDRIAALLAGLPVQEPKGASDGAQTDAGYGALNKRRKAQQRLDVT